MADIVLINPRYSISFWGLEHALPLFGKRANMPVQCLPLLAALTPSEHSVTIVDENVEALDFDRLAKADIVGMTGMSVQRSRMRQICRELKQRGVFVVVGGPWITVQEDDLQDTADVIFIGEADQTWPQFLADWQAGTHQQRYEQAGPTDMETLPPARLELLKNQHYMFGTLQISRGCPFQCEFCDIIVTFGRRPRLKSAAQIVAELDVLHKNGMFIVFIVDDNLIGNKKAVKELLPSVIRWQEEHGYSMTFFTEASIDLAEDEELMDLMGQAGCQSVFVGIESPNPESLREMKKLQNDRAQAGTLLERVHRIQRAGLEVWAGMIVGFDADDAHVFDGQREFLKQARIAHAMVGMLYAIPKTPLYARLVAEGRLDPSDAPEYGTNVHPRQISRQDLCAGYIQLMDDLYQPQAFFDRVDDLYLRGGFRYAAHEIDYWRKHPLQWIWRMGYAAVFFVGVFLQLMRFIPDRQLRRTYRRAILRALGGWPRNPEVWFVYALKCAQHYHFFKLTQQMRQQGVINLATDQGAEAQRGPSGLRAAAGAEDAVS